MQALSYLIPGTFQQMVVEAIESPARFGDDDSTGPTAARLTLTGRPLDIAIQGEGYFQIMLPSGAIAFTRFGSFRLDDGNRLVTHDGNLVLPMVTPPAGSDGLNISPDGVVAAFFSALMITLPLAEIQLARFSNPGALIDMGNGVFLQGGASGAPHMTSPNNKTAGTGKLLQYFLEQGATDTIKGGRKMGGRHKSDHKRTPSSPRLLQAELRIGT